MLMVDIVSVGMNQSMESTVENKVQTGLKLGVVDWTVVVKQSRTVANGGEPRTGIHYVNTVCWCLSLLACWSE